MEGKSVETVYYFFLRLPGLFEGARSFIQSLRVDSALLGATILISSWSITSAMVRSLFCFHSLLAIFRAAFFCLLFSAHRPWLALGLTECFAGLSVFPRASLMNSFAIGDGGFSPKPIHASNIFFSTTHLANSLVEIFLG